MGHQQQSRQSCRQDFLAVTEHGLVNQMRRLFVELTPLTTITTATGPGGGRTIRSTLPAVIAVSRSIKGG